jgi:hypothetical protein
MRLFIRRHLNYANLAATLALVFSMSAGAIAATHYLITSTKQISPKVLRSLRGKTGASGKTGATGPAGPIGPAGPRGLNGIEGKSTPQHFYQHTDAEHVIPEPKEGLGTPIDSLTLPAGTYLVTGTGYIERSGLEKGQGARQWVQLRAEGSKSSLAEQAVECVLGSTGGSSTGAASAAYNITRLVTINGTSQTLIVDAYDETSAGTKSIARGAALTATLVGE